jgi:tRNA uridine 5-carbamoylmethylation protein Kti12
MELVLIRGLPGSGKSTMARVLAQIGFEHYEADQYFMRDGRYAFDAAKLKDAHAWCLKAVNEAMQANLRCVVANTFTQAWEIEPYIKAARENGYQSIRILTATGDYGSVHGVPRDVIDRMANRWESFSIWDIK